MENQIKIIDESGDKKYFSQLPNIVLNHSTANDQALYWQMKRFAGENGKCFATQETLRKKLGIGKQAFNKSIEYLLNKGWIKFEGLTQGKTRPIKTYSIVDIWKQNILEYEKIGIQIAISSKKEKDRDPDSHKIGIQIAIEEEPVKEELIILDSKKNLLTPYQIAKSFFLNEEKQKEIIVALQNKYNNQEIIPLEVKKFISYWTEPNKNGTKQRWEMEKTFEISRRLSTWLNNYKKFQNKNNKINVLEV